MKAEGTSPLRIEAEPILPRLRQHHEGADQVGFDERGGAVDRSIDMAFRGEVRDNVGPEIADDGPDRLGIADVSPNEAVAFATRHGFHCG